MTMPAKIAVTVSPGLLLHGTTATVTVTVKSFDGHVVAGARVAVSGAGLKGAAKNTGTAGQGDVQAAPAEEGHDHLLGHEDRLPASQEDHHVEVATCHRGQEPLA